MGHIVCWEQLTCRAAFHKKKNYIMVLKAKWFISPNPHWIAELKVKILRRLSFSHVTLSKFFQIFVYGVVLKFGRYWPWKTVSSHLNCTTLLTLGSISYHSVTQVLTFSQTDLAFKLYHYLLASSDTFILITCPLAKNSSFTDPLFPLKSPPSALADYRKEK